MTKRLRLVLSAEQQRMVEQLRAEAERERPEYVAEARRMWQANAALQPELQNVLSLLIAVRKAQGVSLNELAERTGISKSELSRLESDPAAKVQINTLQRIAAALGKEVRISLSAGPDKPAKPVRRSAAASAR